MANGLPTTPGDALTGNALTNRIVGSNIIRRTLTIEWDCSTPDKFDTPTTVTFNVPLLGGGNYTPPLDPRSR